MIQIKISNIDDIVNEHYMGVKDFIRLELFSKKDRRYIETNLERIIKAKKDDFKTIIKESKSINSKKIKLAFVGSQKKQKNKIGAYNGYNKFSNKNTSPYNAYTLANNLKVNICPYCNINYTHTIKSINNQSTRPEFDHFICKNKHPIFALSFYNLIPSCSICNSSIKGQSKFSYETHLHPYFDDFNSIKKFNIDRTLLSLIHKNDTFKIVFKNKIDADEVDIKRADNHIKDFALEAIYNAHQDKVLDLIDFSRIYNEDAFQNLVNTFKDSTEIFKDTNDVKRLLIGHHVEDENIDKRPLNKLVKDISEELGLL